MVTKINTSGDNIAMGVIIVLIGVHARSTGAPDKINSN